MAVRLDLASALEVNPRHVKIISLEQKQFADADHDLTILQVLLCTPPNSALSLANVGTVLNDQAAKARAVNKRREQATQLLFPHDTSIASFVSAADTFYGHAGKLYVADAMSQDTFARSFTRLRSDEPLPTKVGRIGGSCKMSRRVSGLQLNSRHTVVSLLQLVETIEVKAAGPMTRSSGNWRVCLYTALLLLTLGSLTYLTSAFGMLSSSMPLRSPTIRPTSTGPATQSPHLASRPVFGGARLEAALRSGGGGRGARSSSGGGVTQLQMLEPMTLGVDIK